MDTNIIKYDIGTPHSFVYHPVNAAGTPETQTKTITYYQGRLFFNRDGAAGHETDMEVSFVSFDLPQQARQIFERNKMVSHPRVLRAWFSTFDHSIKKHIVCFDRFSGFLPDSRPTWLETPMSSSIPGLPNKELQREVRDLAMALEHIQSKGVSHSSLHQLSSYVWCHDEIKIINVDDYQYDFWDDLDPSSTEKQWIGRKDHHLKLFGKGLEYHILKTEGDWAERTSFLKCFNINVEIDRHLKVVYTHPFLMKETKNIMQIFADAYHALVSMDYGGLKVHRLDNALANNAFDSDFMIAGRGWGRPMSQKFTDFIKFSSSAQQTSQSTAPVPNPNVTGHVPTPGPSAPHWRGSYGFTAIPTSHATRAQAPHATRPRAQAPHATRAQAPHATPSPTPTTTPASAALAPNQYNTSSVHDLLRFLRNLFEHYYQHGMGINFIYDEVRKYWPNLVDRIHEKI